MNEQNNTINPLFDECELNGKPYKHGDYKSVCVHDNQNIKGFFSEYRYLSNFYACLVCHDTLPFPSSEHAYMFAKLDQSKMSDIEIKSEYDKVFNMTAREVKKWGQTVDLRPDWEKIKYDIMATIVFDKFSRNLDLREKLLATGDKYLEELNWWHDICWGVDIKKGGSNWLGKILMKTREFWKKETVEKPFPACESFIEERSKAWDKELKNPLP